MGIFEKKKKKPPAVMATAPETSETPGEIKHIEELSNADATPSNADLAPVSNVEYRELPVCMSQTQINNMVIENNMMLKHIVSKIEE